MIIGSSVILSTYYFTPPKVMYMPTDISIYVNCQPITSILVFLFKKQNCLITKTANTKFFSINRIKRRDSSIRIFFYWKEDHKQLSTQCKNCWIFEGCFSINKYSGISVEDGEAGRWMLSFPFYKVHSQIFVFLKT